MKQNKRALAKQYEKERQEFYDSVNNQHRIDNSFKRKDDVDLTEDEIRQIDEFWGKYKFAYPNINYESFKTFKNRYVRFDPKHIPGEVRTQYLSPYFYNADYSQPMQNKSMTDWLYPDIKSPYTIVRHMTNLLLDHDCNVIGKNRMISLILDYCNENDCGVLFKLDKYFGGKGVFVIHKGDLNEEILSDYIHEFRKKDYVVQAFLKQSEFMNRLNSSSVNTVRMTTLIHNGRARVLASLIRVGNPSADVDNWSSGGMIIGLNKKTGKLNKWYLGNDLYKRRTMPCGIDLKTENLVVPNYDKIVESCLKCHYRNPYIKMISWDIALDENDEPNLIECNFGGMIQIHEAVTGPLFGPLTESVLDLYLIKKFFLMCVEGDFECKEYTDYINIVGYLGNKKNVTIPATLRDKPVKMLERDTFTDTDVKSVTLSQEQFDATLYALKDIETVNIK